MSKAIYWLAAIGLAAIGACLAAAAYTDYPMLWVLIAAMQGCLLGLHLAADGKQRFDRKVAVRTRAVRDKQLTAIGLAISEAFLAGWSASREGHNADLDGDKPFEESVAKVELDKYLDQLLEQTEGEAR